MFYPMPIRLSSKKGEGGMRAVNQVDSRTLPFTWRKRTAKGKTPPSGDSPGGENGDSAAHQPVRRFVEARMSSPRAIERKGKDRHLRVTHPALE